MLALFLSFFQEKLIFRSTTLPEDYTYEFDQPFEEINLQSADGAVLNALHFKIPQSKGVILYFHGNAGNLSRWGEITSFFTRFNYDVLVMDYRGYGKSTGKLSEKALYKDAQLFYDFLRKMYKEEDIIIYGRSLGTTFATAVAAKNKPQRLILESPFYNLTSIAKRKFPVLPVHILLRYRFPTNRLIQKIDCGLILIHGTQDAIIPLDSGEKLFKTAPAKNKYFYPIKGAGHNNLSEFRDYHQVLAEIFS